MEPEPKIKDTISTNEKIEHLSKDAFNKIEKYLQSELLVYNEDTELLNNMNLATAGKYSDMKTSCQKINEVLEELQKKYKFLEPYLNQIDQLEYNTTILENHALKISDYARKLESTFKALERH